MIEAPEARYLCEQLNSTIQGKLITNVFAQFTPHKFAWFYGKPEKYAEQLIGKIIGRSRPQGGMVEITIEEMILVLTDGVNLQYFAAGEKLPVKHQLLIGFEDESCIIASVRMYGGLWCFPKGGFNAPIADYYETAKRKPQVMSEDFTQTYFMELINAESVQKKSTKAFLATEQNIPGLGNGVLQDILYHAHIHPKRKISELEEKDKENLFYHIKRTMQEIYLKGGRSTETDLFGVSGKYISCLSKNTAGKSCPLCGETIVKESYLGGSIYYCRGCQPLNNE